MGLDYNLTSWKTMLVVWIPSDILVLDMIAWKQQEDKEANRLWTLIGYKLQGNINN